MLLLTNDDVEQVLTMADCVDVLRRFFEEEGKGQVFRFRKLEVATKPKVRIHADNKQLGRTPATISAELSALQVILPK